MPNGHAGLTRFNAADGLDMHAKARGRGSLPSPAADRANFAAAPNSRIACKASSPMSAEMRLPCVMGALSLRALPDRFCVSVARRHWGRKRKFAIRVAPGNSGAGHTDSHAEHVRQRHQLTSHKTLQIAAGMRLAHSVHDV